MNTMEPKTQNFTIKFGGQENRLDALTLVYSILGFSTVIQELNTSIYPEQKVDIKIKATQPGSFEVVCQLVEYALDTLPLIPIVISDNQEYLKGLLNLFKEFIEIKKLLGKEKPNKIEENGQKVIIEGNKGNIEVSLYAYNFYNNNTAAHSAMSKAFRSLEQDQEVESLRIIEDESKELVEIDKADFPKLAETVEDVESENIQEVIRIAMLKILKIVFDKNRMWEFVYNNIKISARIEDELFIKKIIEKEVKFGQGDILKARIKIKQIYNDQAKEFLNDSYSILEVLELIETPPSIQSKFPE